MDSNNITDLNVKIFQSITTLVQDTEFSDASCSFLSLHMDKFDEEDENKLEYTTIFEEYVQILEKVIDTKLFEQYQEDEVRAFYKDFADNFKKYEELNLEVVETLFGFTDFNVFKKQVLELKKSQKNAPEGMAGNPELNKLDESFFWSIYKEDVNDKSLGWQKKITHDGNIHIEIWQRPQKNGGDVIGRSSILYKGVKLSTLMTMLKDFDKHQPKTDAVREQKIMDRDEFGMPTKVYSRFKMPLMTERESLCRLRMDRNLTGEFEGKIGWFMNSVEDPDYPISKDKIRISLYKGLLFWEEDGHTRAHELSTFNMGGYFPMRLMNMAIGSMIKKQMEEQHKILLQIQKEAESTGSNTE